MRNLLLLSALALGGTSQAITLTFEDLTEGDTLANQYSGLVFSSGDGGYSVPNPSSSTQGFATNTPLTVTSTDVGGGVTSPISGNLVHSFGAWLSEDGDPVFNVAFSTAVSSVSIDFGGIATPAEVGIYAFDGATAVGSSLAGATGTTTVTVSAANITNIVVTPGSFNDWVGFDNFTYEPVPEPGTILALGAGAAALARRRKKA